MLAFAKLYDPQDIHIDAEKANADLRGFDCERLVHGAKAMPIYTRHYLSMRLHGVAGIRQSYMECAGARRDILTVKVTIKRKTPAQA